LKAATMTSTPAVRPWIVLAVAVAATALGPRPVPARGADARAYRVRRGEVRVVCPLTVGGSFDTRTTSISGTMSLGAAPAGALSGEMRVDLASLDTGIALRNTHLRENYLEVGRGAEFAAAVLSGVHLDKLDTSGFRGRTPFTGTLLLHGTRRPVAGQADIRPEGSELRIDASFPLRLDDHGIAAPRYLGVGVKNEVLVKVWLMATPAPVPSADGTR
jgi:polyisoprenoid-binding protein YceI